MALSEALKTFTYIAETDLSGSQFLFVKAGTGAKSAILATAGSDALGVLYSPEIAGRAVTVATAGICKVWAGGSITPGAKIASDANGRAVTATTGDRVLGTALSAGVSGVPMEVLFERNGVA